MAAAMAGAKIKGTRMKAYALYVWPCYGFTFGLLGLMLLSTLVEWRNAVKAARQLGSKEGGLIRS